MLLSSSAAPGARELAPSVAPPAVQAVDIDEHLGQALDTSITLTDMNGAEVRLADYFADGKPVLLVLAYFRCPMLCDLVLSGVVQSLKQLDWRLGAEYRVLTVSFDPSDTARGALRKQITVLQELGRPESTRAWPFLVAGEPAIQRLADELGFRYAYDPHSKQYAHPAAIFFLTPRARISRYLYGIEFRPRDVKLALLEASQGRVGTIVDRILLTCFRFDPALRKYRLLISGILKGGSLAVLLAVGGGIGLLWRRERMRQVGARGRSQA